MQTLPCLGIENRPSASSHDNSVQLSQISNSLRLATTETILTFDFENRWDSNSGPRHDLVIRVEKHPPQPTRQLTTYRRFPSAHQAH